MGRRALRADLGYDFRSFEFSPQCQAFPLFKMISSHSSKSPLSFNLAYIALEDEKHVGLDFLKLSTSLQPTNHTFTEIQRPSHLFISFSTRGGESHFS
jgi:hypothetical protein